MTGRIPVKSRIKEIFIDWLFISIYLMALVFVTAIVYFIRGGLPTFSEIQMQLLATSTSVVPILLIFSLMDYRQGTLGKRGANLKLVYKNKSFGASLARNAIKFLPWQIAHIGVIHGTLYSRFDIWALGLCIAGMALGIVLLVMAFLREDQRHLGDLLAGTQLVAVFSPDPFSKKA